MTQGYRRRSATAEARIAAELARLNRRLKKPPDYGIKPMLKEYRRQRAALANENGPR